MFVEFMSHVFVMWYGTVFYVKLLDSLMISIRDGCGSD